MTTFHSKKHALKREKIDYKQHSKQRNKKQ